MTYTNLGSKYPTNSPSLFRKLDQFALCVELVVATCRNRSKLCKIKHGKTTQLINICLKSTQEILGGVKYI